MSPLLVLWDMRVFVFRCSLDTSGKPVFPHVFVNTPRWHVQAPKQSPHKYNWYQRAEECAIVVLLSQALIGQHP